MRATALGIRFGLELCILASFAALAAHLSAPLPERVLLGLVFCAAGAVVWGAFLSPKRKHEIGLFWRLVLEAAFFAGAATILCFLGWPLLGLFLVLMAVADRVALALFE